MLGHTARIGDVSPGDLSCTVHFLHYKPLQHPTAPETAAKMSQTLQGGVLFLSIAFHAFPEHLRHTDRRVTPAVIVVLAV